MLPRLKNRYYYSISSILTVVIFGLFNLITPRYLIGVDVVAGLLIGFLSPLVFIILGLIHRSSNLPIEINSLAFMYYNLEPESKNFEKNQQNNSVNSHESGESDETKAKPAEEDGEVEATGSEDGEPDVVKLKSQAESELESAAKATASSEFELAIEHYKEAINYYQTGLNEVEMGESRIKNELSEAIEVTREDVERAKVNQSELANVFENLKPAERSFQEAIVAYLQDDRTVARIRFRQARDTFEDAIEIIENSDAELLASSIDVPVNPDRKLSSTKFDEMEQISETVSNKLNEAGIKTIDDLKTNNEPPWTPASIKNMGEANELSDETVVVLTVLSWWHGNDRLNFDTVSDISHRYEQADYGFDRSS